MFVSTSGDCAIAQLERADVLASGVARCRQTCLRLPGTLRTRARLLGVGSFGGNNLRRRRGVLWDLYTGSQQNRGTAGPRHRIRAVSRSVSSLERERGVESSEECFHISPGAGG